MAKPHRSTGKKILIVEDDKVLGEILLKKFLRDGYVASLARDGEEGLAAIRGTKPDLVLLDILMPKLDGYQVLEQMNTDGSIKTTPVIIISNSGQPVEIERALKLGAKDCLVKTQFSPDEVMDKVEQQLGQGLRSKISRPSKSGKAKVMMIEDDKFLRDLAVKKITQAGYQMVTAVDGAEAVAVAIKEKPSLILLDIILPGMDGFEVLRNLKENTQLKNIPVILMSNLGQESDIERGTQLGAVEYLVKAHYTLDEIVEKIKKYVG